MKIIILALLISLVIEFITIYSRMVLHKQSALIQKRMHLPRIHHSYPGLAILLIDYVYLQNEWFFIIGFSLILSDVFHHLVFEPFIFQHQYDIGMKRHKMARAYVASLPAAMALIVIGIFALVTPFTPGSWLALIGGAMVIGKDPRTLHHHFKNKYLPLQKSSHRRRTPKTSRV